MKITVGQLKRIIREAVGELAPTTDLQDITTPRERKNGTRTYQDPVTADVYKLNDNGYVRMYTPDWELEGHSGKSPNKFQRQNPVIVLAPSNRTYRKSSTIDMDGRSGYATGDMRAQQQAALDKYVAKRRSSLKAREEFTAKHKAGNVSWPGDYEKLRSAKRNGVT